MRYPQTLSLFWPPTGQACPRCSNTGRTKRPIFLHTDGNYTICPRCLLRGNLPEDLKAKLKKFRMAA